MFGQAIFALCKLNTGLDQRKAAHKLTIFLTHDQGFLNADDQKFVMLVRTDLISFNLPVIERSRVVHVLNLARIISISGI